MSTIFFQCPNCQEDFSCPGTDKEALILCPKCGAKRDKKEFLRLFFCPECKKSFRSKIDENEKALTCPHCQSSFSPEEGRQLKSIGNSGTLPSFRTASNVPDRPRGLLKEGDIFDKYKILRLLGRGGMAEVYLAEHMILGHYCALKCLLPALSSSTVGDPIARKRFIREAKLSRAISHPNIVSIYDAGCDENSGILFIVMEYVEGETLAQAAQNPLSEEELLEIASQMASALEALDKCRIVHRDIKPSNIMRQADGTIKLMDLGIAKSNSLISGGEYPLTMDKSVFGTPAYASPEQCKDSHKTDSRSDIYSLGASLYHLATGKLPHDGTTPVEIICNVLKNDPESLITLRPDISEKTCNLIESMMAKDPEKRPGNPLLLQRKIRKIRGNLFYSLACFLKNHWKSASIFLLLLLLFAGFYTLFPPRSQEKDPVSAAAKPPVRFVPFREMDFRNKGEKRTLENRLNEVRRILAFLEKPGNTTKFHTERLEMYQERAGFLTRLLNEKKQRTKPGEKVTISQERLKSIAAYIRNRRRPFSGTAKDTSFGMQLLVDVYNNQLDPNEEFINFRGDKYPLLFHVLSGILLPTNQLLHGFIREGADVDFEKGSIPISGVSGGIFFNSPNMNSMELLIRSGRNNVDHFWHIPILPSCFEMGRRNGHGEIVTNEYNWKLAEFLVDSGCRTEIANPAGMTIAHFAAAWDKEALLKKLLLSNSPILTQKDKAGLTPWHHAVRNDALNVIKLLKQFEIPPTGISEKDYAQKDLFHAIRIGDGQQLERALKKGADLKYIYGEGLNALQNAIRFRQHDIMERLLKWGADVRDNENAMSPLEIAIRTRQPRAFKRILEKWIPSNWMIPNFNGGEIYLPFRIVCSCHMDPTVAKELLDILLEKNWKINDSPNKNYTTLHCALFHSNIHWQLLEYLLKKGADPYRKNYQNKNAFQMTKDPVLLSVLEKYRKK